MKFDLHCHTKEGSLDSKVSVREFADKFMKLGFDGFMISDHNSYKGCKAWDRIKHEPKYSSLTVIRGIEYDTKDAGHVLVIMPDDVYLPGTEVPGHAMPQADKSGTCIRRHTRCSTPLWCKHIQCHGIQTDGCFSVRRIRLRRNIQYM